MALFIQTLIVGITTGAIYALIALVLVVSWYLRLNGQGEMPDWGIVRLEIPKNFFEEVIKCDFSYLNYLSNIVYAYRCRGTSYSRAPISIYPVQRAEESLGALFTPIETLVQRFYRYTNL